MTNFKDQLATLTSPQTAHPDWKDRPAIIHSTGERAETVSFGQLEKLVNEARGLLARSECVNDKNPLVLSSPNTPHLTAFLLAAWKLGVMAIPVDFRVTTGELANIARSTGAKVIYLDSKQRAAELGNDFQIITPDSLEGEKIAIADRGHDPDSPALVILTSGSTGQPKGAVHDLGSLFNNVEELTEMLGINQDSMTLLPLPFSHIFGLAVLLASLMKGGTLLLSDFTPEVFLGSVRKFKPNIVVGVPTVYGLLASLPEVPPEFKSVKKFLSGGAPLPPSLAADFEKKIGRKIRQGYGLTETKILSVNLTGPVESVGTPAPSVVIDIVDEKDNKLPEGQQGEIRVSGPTLMLGYLGQPELTAKVLRNGSFYTGDLGYMKDGQLFISGRSKELIIVAGTNVFPAEVESVLRQHPAVHEVAVVGLPHSRLGQIVKAIIVVKDGNYTPGLCGGNDDKKKAEDQLRALFKEFCKDNLKREMRPMNWEFRPLSCPLPKTPTGKIDKKQLAAVTG